MVGACTEWFDTAPVTLDLCDPCDLLANPIPNTIMEGAMACPENDPGLITDVASPPASPFVTYEYEWEFSTDNGTTWSLISGGALEYDPPVIAEDRLYRRKVRVVGCTVWQLSNEVAIDLCLDPCDYVTNLSLIHI